MKILLNIIIFILCLSLVVCIHEAGHLLVAKMCNIYCFEYSIGFGPKIFKKRFRHKKKVIQDGKPVFEARTDGKKVPMTEKVEGETAFALRWIPLGGYVAMAGEDGNMTEDGKVIPPERCLNSANHAKQICIMLAGIVMNFILAWVLFFFAALCPMNKQVADSNQIIVQEKSKADEAGIKTGDKITYLYQEYQGLSGEEGTLYFPSTKEETKVTTYQTADGQATTSNQTYDDLDKDCISYVLQDVFKTSYQKLFTLPESFKNVNVSPDSKRIIHLKTDRSGDEWITVTLSTQESKDKNGLPLYFFEPLGVSPSTTVVQYTGGEAFVASGKQFGTMFVGIYSSLGSLFTPEGWKNVGGIISVYRMSAMGVESGSFSYFLLLWGYISLNLGCFNLLPFPGLDGWQTLLALFETVTRKKVPTKFKTIANTVGLIILMILAGLLIVKDLIV